ncbi:polysaccharide export protein [candidate division KSB1 bacterium]|nr:polysaccharide export protein [candidate division KSB1 bacterium]
MFKVKFSVLFALAGFLIMLPPLAHAQEYRLDKGDLITVNFWQQPDLKTQTRIDNEGKIDLPVIGRIAAAGQTVDQLRRTIVDKISVYNSKITQVAIEINEYGSRRYFITGAVTAPGKYTFNKVPTIWEAILEAGGPLPSARLESVKVIRGGQEKSQILEVDLTAAFTGGDMSNLPKLQPGDNIDVPGVPAGQAGAGALQSNLINNKNTIYVFGYVVTPGIYPLEKNMDVLQAIILAGGPLLQQGGGGGVRPTREPDLKNVKIISRGPEAPVVYSVNIENYTKQANPIPLVLRPGDTIFIPGREDYRRFLIGTTLGEILRGSIAIVTSYILLNQLFGQGNNNNNN